MRPVRLLIDPADVDANGIAESQKPTGAGDLTLDGALTSSGAFDVSDSDSAGIKGRVIAITSTANDSAKTFTITGTDPDGAALTEAVTGPNATTVRSAGYFRTISQIAVSAATTGDITVGTSNATNSLCTATIPLNWRSQYPATIILEASSGTFSIDVDQTFDDLAGQTGQDVSWFEINGAKTADAVLTSPARYATGIRLTMTSYTNGAAATLAILQT